MAPALVARLNNALRRADQIEWSETEGRPTIDYMLPIVADAEAGFGGPLNAFELMKAMIEAGAAGVHFEDQLSSAKKCGHMGGKVLVPTSQHIATLKAAVAEHGLKLMTPEEWEAVRQEIKLLQVKNPIGRSATQPFTTMPMRARTT